MIDGLPEQVEIAGQQVPISSDFRTGILFEELLQDPGLDDLEKLQTALHLYFPGVVFDYDVLDEADKRGSDLVLIDTAGRLHTSPELMRELAKVVNVTRKRAANMAAGPMPVPCVLVIDADTGQNGLNQALEFNEALGLDGIIMTKLDGTAKGGIAMAVAEKLKLPILRIGVGEQVDDLQEFNAKDFCRALVGESN
mgnify:CR=1 FL=1